MSIAEFIAVRSLYTTGFSEVLHEDKKYPTPSWTRSPANDLGYLERWTLSAPAVSPIRFLTREEQGLFERALGRSVKIIAQGRRR
jgi:hypothetical protein